MYLDFDALMKCVDNVDSGFECVALFKAAQTQMMVIYNELKQKVYKYDKNRYQQCRKQLNDGIAKMNSEKDKFKRVTQYERLVECTERCAHSEDSYANAWDKIIDFNVNNPHPNTQRNFGYHAFLNANIDDMLHELKMLGSCK
jgi:hypothetical protein